VIGDRLVFDPLIDSALIGVAGVAIGIFGYAFQNWLVKKAEREKAEDDAKRAKYEMWITTFVRGFFETEGEQEKPTKNVTNEMNQANNLIMLYGSDVVVKTVCKLWTTPLEDTPEGYKKRKTQMQEIILAMRKDLVHTDLNVVDIEFLKV
jgi:hypothetical protein